MAEHESIINESNFDELVVQASGPVLVDFWAEWCGPCKMLGPTIAELASQYAGRAVVGKVNVDENQGLAEKYGIRGIPTLILFKNGEVVEQVVGVQPKQHIEQLIDKHLA